MCAMFRKKGIRKKRIIIICLRIACLPQILIKAMQHSVLILVLYKPCLWESLPLPALDVWGHTPFQTHQHLLPFCWAVHQITFLVPTMGCVMWPVTFFRGCLLPAGERSSETIWGKTLGVIMLYEGIMPFRFNFTRYQTSARVQFIFGCVHVKGHNIKVACN